jgi:hypothetical protein
VNRGGRGDSGNIHGVPIGWQNLQLGLHPERLAASEIGHLPWNALCKGDELTIANDLVRLRATVIPRYSEESGHFA